MAPHFHNTFAGILTAEISVLDDISRAPGEALNVLLRILNERKFGNDEIPLVTAMLLLHTLSFVCHSDIPVARSRTLK